MKALCYVGIGGTLKWALEGTAANAEFIASGEWTRAPQFDLNPVE